MLRAVAEPPRLAPRLEPVHGNRLGAHALLQAEFAVHLLVVAALAWAGFPALRAWEDSETEGGNGADLRTFLWSAAAAVLAGCATAPPPLPAATTVSIARLYEQPAESMRLIAERLLPKLH